MVMIYRRCSSFQFHDAFASNKQRKDTFSYEGLNALYNYFDDRSEDTGKDMELDVVTTCCEYTEYENIAEYLDDYPSDSQITNLEELSEHTIVIPIGDTGRFIMKNW
jgi:hypothetical protein